MKNSSDVLLAVDSETRLHTPRVRRTKKAHPRKQDRGQDVYLESASLLEDISKNKRGVRARKENSARERMY